MEGVMAARTGAGTARPAIAEGLNLPGIAALPMMNVGLWSMQIDR